jgi:hypothetical protein
MFKQSYLTGNFILLVGTPVHFPLAIRHAYLKLLAEDNTLHVNENRLTSAHQWAIILSPDSTRIVAAAALKLTRTNLRYYQKIFGPQKASLSLTLNPTRYVYGLGFIVIAPAFRNRGYCDILLDALLEQSGDGGVLATAQEQCIKDKLRRKGFERQGFGWRAGNGGMMSLYLRPGRDPATT